MKLTSLKSLVCILATLMVSSASAQMTFDNNSVMNMFTMGFSEDFIVGQIFRMPGNYETSPTSLTALKHAGVGAKAIAAMVNRATAPVPPAGVMQTVINSQIAIPGTRENSHLAVVSSPNLEGRSKTTKQNIMSAVYSSADKKSARVYVTDDPIFEHTGIVRGSSATHVQNGTDPRTMEIQADIAQRCPGVIVTNNPQAANYVLTLRRRGGERSSMFAFGGLTGLALGAGMKVNGASLFDRNGDMVCAVKERSVEGAVKKMCRYISKSGER